MKRTLIVIDMQNDFIDGALGTKEVHGNCGSIDCSGSCKVDGDVNRSIDASGSVTCGNVSGDIDASGSVRCKR